MTYGGGKPHEIGDRGQRYEVTFFNPQRGLRVVLGWAEELKVAQTLADAVNDHPSWREPEIEDRGEQT